MCLYCTTKQLYLNEQTVIVVIILIFLLLCTDQCKLYFMETREMNGKELKVCFNTKVIHNASVYREIFLYRGNGDVV